MRFSLKSLFVVTTLACLAFAAIRLFGIGACIQVSVVFVVVGFSALIGAVWFKDATNSRALGAIIGAILGILIISSMMQAI
jgi:hypothetical protein